MDKISNHISFKEAVRSSTAVRKNIDNTPNDQQLTNMKILAENVFEPLRIWAEKPIYISSFFRSTKLNLVIGGSKTSQHCAEKGAAIDIDADVFGGKSNKELFEHLRDTLEFDTLIWEFGDDDQPAWVHVSYHNDNNRKRILKAYNSESGTKYKTINGKV